jgi:hypothetical protein
MSGINKHMIRRLLIDNPDGLTLRQISKVTGITIESCINSLKRCYGCYVSHWQEASPERKILCQVWKCVSVPKDAPKPHIKKTPEELKQYQAEYQAEYRMKLRNEQLDRQIRREAEKYKKQRAAERVKKKPVKIKEVKAPVFTSTGLTTIRGPWPTMQ